MTSHQRIQERLSALINKGEAVLTTHESNPPGMVGFPTLDTQRFVEWRSQGLVCLEQVFGKPHAYTESFRSGTESGAYTGCVQAGSGILQAALEDVEQGHLLSLQDMVTAEVFSDFLEQADHLLEHGYSAPAASLAGAVLENGLRSLAERNEIPVKARDNLSTLNQKLSDNGVYNRLRQKQIEAWIEVRNNADHGRFDEFDAGHVADLIKGARGFLAEML